MLFKYCSVSSELTDPSGHFCTHKQVFSYCPPVIRKPHVVALYLMHGYLPFCSVRFWPMGWQCKICRSLFATKGNLLKHYRLQHATFSRGQSQPCLHDGCPCTFKTQTALRTHLSRYHAVKESIQSGLISGFKCLVCAVCSAEKDYFQHIGNHLKIHETVFCVFEGCDFRTNIYNTFLKHKSRKHIIFLE